MSRSESGSGCGGDSISMDLNERIRAAEVRFRQLMGTISKTQGVLVTETVVKSNLDKSTQAAQNLQRQLTEFDKVSQKEHQKLAKLRTKSIKHVWYRAQGHEKLQEKLGDQEAKFLKEFEVYQTNKEALDEMSKQVKKWQGSWDHVCLAKSEHHAAKDELDRLLDSLFKGPTPPYPHEDQLEHELTEVLRQLANAYAELERRSHVVTLVTKANQTLTEAAQHMQGALQMNTFDMFTRGPLPDIMISSSMANARNLVVRAQVLIAQAKELDPNIPHMSDVNIDSSFLIFNLFFDNLWTDLMMRQQIMQSFQRLNGAQHAMLTVVNAVQDQLARADSTHTQIRSRKETLETQVWNERVTIIKDILGSGNGDTDQLPVYVP